MSDIRTPKDARSVETQERMLRQVANEAVERYAREVFQTGAGRERTRAQFEEQRALFQQECARFDELLTKSAPRDRSGSPAFGVRVPRGEWKISRNP